MARGELRDTRYADTVYFDKFTGELLFNWRSGTHASLGDGVVYWISLLHFGTFGGVGVKILWTVLGLAPVVLFVTGSLMWWNRVLSKKWARLKTGRQDEDHPMGTGKDATSTTATKWTRRGYIAGSPPQPTKRKRTETHGTFRSVSVGESPNTMPTGSLPPITVEN